MLLGLCKWVEGESEMGVIGEQNIFFPCLCVCRGKRRTVSFKTALFHFFFLFSFFFLRLGKKMNLGNNPKIGYNRHNQTFFIKKESIFIHFLWSVLFSPHPPDNTISSPHIQYSMLSSHISFLSECAF